MYESIQDLQAEKEKLEALEVKARELEMERDSMRRFLRQSMSPRPGTPSSHTPVVMRPIHA